MSNVYVFGAFPLRMQYYDPDLISAGDLGGSSPGRISLEAPSLFDIGDVKAGEATVIMAMAIENTGSGPPTRQGNASDVRVFARCNNGLYAGQQTEFGQEAVTEQWIEADIGAGFVPVGGDYSPTDPASNYVSIPDIGWTFVSNIIVFRLNIPSSVETVGELYVEFGVSAAY